MTSTPTRLKRPELVFWAGLAAAVMLWYAGAAYLGPAHLGETGMLVVNGMVVVMLAAIVVGLGLGVYSHVRAQNRGGPDD